MIEWLIENSNQIIIIIISAFIGALLGGIVSPLVLHKILNRGKVKITIDKEKYLFSSGFIGNKKKEIVNNHPEYCFFSFDLRYYNHSNSIKVAKEIKIVFNRKIDDPKGYLYKSIDVYHENEKCQIKVTELTFMSKNPYLERVELIVGDYDFMKIVKEIGFRYINEKNKLKYVKLKEFRNFFIAEYKSDLH